MQNNDFEKQLNKLLNPKFIAEDKDRVFHKINNNLILKENMKNENISKPVETLVSTNRKNNFNWIFFAAPLTLAVLVVAIVGGIILAQNNKPIENNPNNQANVTTTTQTATPLPLDTKYGNIQAIYDQTKDSLVWSMPEPVTFDWTTGCQLGTIVNSKVSGFKTTVNFDNQKDYDKYSELVRNYFNPSEWRNEACMSAAATIKGQDGYQRLSDGTRALWMTEEKLDNKLNFISGYWTIFFEIKDPNISSTPLPPMTSVVYPNTYTMVAGNNKITYSAGTLPQLNKGDSIMFLLDNGEQSGYYFFITDPSGNVVEAFGINNNPIAINYGPHTSKVFTQSGNYTVKLYGCLNTQCASQSDTPIVYEMTISVL